MRDWFNSPGHSEKMRKTARLRLRFVSPWEFGVRTDLHGQLNGIIKTLPLFPCAKRNSSCRTAIAAERRKDRAEQNGLSVRPWSPVPWISRARGKVEAARIGFSCVLLGNSKWQHTSFLHYSLRIMLMHNGGNVTSSLFTYQAKTCHGGILTSGICRGSWTLPLTARVSSGWCKMKVFIYLFIFPDVSQYASIQISTQDLLRSQDEKTAAKLGFHKTVVRILKCIIKRDVTKLMYWHPFLTFPCQ